MACLHPLRAFWTGCYTSKGKKDYVLVKSSTALDLSLQVFKKNYRGRNYDPSILISKNGDLYFTQSVALPCGQCIECRLAYSREWAVRCYHEASFYKYNSFLTLTYDDEHLPKNNSISKRDFQLFMKRLREALRPLGFDNIRFFGCGEYGEKSGRPHYHLILFNANLFERPFGSSQNNKTYVSDIVSKCWTYGNHLIGKVTFESCSYVARYVTKKLTGIGSKFYDEKNITAPFVLMSRRPGIGRAYFDAKYNTIYATDEVYYKSADGVLKVTKPPKYFDSLFESINPNRLETLKEERRYKGINSHLSKMYDLELDYLSFARRTSELAQQALKILVRPL